MKIEIVKLPRATQWRKDNPEKYAATKLAYKEKQKIADKNYYERTKEKTIARQMAYDKKNEKKVREYRQKWRKENAENTKPYMVEWRKNNKELCLTYHINRKARKQKNGGVASKNIFTNLMVSQKGLCACCRVNIEKNKPHLDHIIALSKGGGSEDSNLQLLCAKCNLQKKNRCPIEFMQSRGYLL